MDILSLSSTLSPQLLPQIRASSLKFPYFLPKFHPSNPNLRISTPTLRSSSFPAPKNSLNFHQSIQRSPNFDLGFEGYELSPIMGSSAAAPQTPATAMRGAEADVMGMLFKERIVFLGTSIDDFVADAIISQLMLLDAQDHTKDIRLFINSSGGSLSSAMAIFDVVQLLRSQVSTIAFGIAASTASIILCGGAKGKRLAMPNARIMIHQPQGGASGQAIDVEIQAQEIIRNKNNVIRIISERTNRPFEQVERDIDRDRYMSPMEALEYGLIDGVIDRDKIIPPPPLPERVKSRFSYEEISKDPRKFLTPEIPDDEIY